MAAFAYAIVLIIAMLMPQVRELERAGGGSVTGWDKVLHAAAFAVLGALTSASFANISRFAGGLWTAPLALVVAGGFGIVHESLQAQIPGFVTNSADSIANLVGVVLGSVAVYGLRVIKIVLRAPAGGASGGL